MEDIIQRGHAPKPHGEATPGDPPYAHAAADPAADTAGHTPRTIGRGAQATVELDTATNIVCKRFHTSARGAAAEVVQHEYEYLQRLTAALANEPYLTCPKPLRIDLARGRVWMTYCDGMTLDALLAGCDERIDAQLEHIAEQIARTVEVFVDEFGEPYDDLTTLNMLYDPTAKTLSVLDFASPYLSSSLRDRRAQVSIAVGKFVGRCVLSTVLRRRWRNATYWTRHRTLLAALVHRAARNDLDESLVKTFADIMLRDRIAARPPRDARRMWLRTAGTLLFRRRIRDVLRAAEATRAPREP